MLLSSLFIYDSLPSVIIRHLTSYLYCSIYVEYQAEKEKGIMMLKSDVGWVYHRKR